MTPYFAKLDVYQLSVTIARWVAKTPFPRGRSHLKDQALRAAESVVLNIAEGFGRPDRARRNHFSIAKGSAGEVYAVLDLLELPGGAQRQEELYRVIAMLSRLR